MMKLYKKVFDSNRDLLSRIKEEKVHGKYLKTEDVLLINIGKPTESISVETPDGQIIIHFNPRTYKITGFTLPCFREFAKKVEMEYRQKLSKKAKATPSSAKRIIEPVATRGMAFLTYGFAF